MMTFGEYVFAGIAVGVAQAVIILIAWRRGYNAAARDAEQRMSFLMRLEDSEKGGG